MLFNTTELRTDRGFKVPVPTTSRYPAPLGPLRLALASEFASRAIDGVWWPYSRDLTSQAPHLVDEFPAHRGRVDRLVYSPADWDLTADHVFTRHGRLKVGFLPARRGHFLLVRLLDGHVLRIAVVHVGGLPAPPPDRRPYPR